MSNSAESALQKAVYDALSVLVPATVTGVFDFVPENQETPYIELGEAATAPFDTKDSDGQDHLVTVHTWTEKGGQKQAQEIMDSIYGILHNGSINVAGHQVILCQFDFGTVLKDPDGFTFHGIQRFRVITEDN